MKRVRFINKKENTTKDYTVGQLGERIFALVYNVKETNDAIRWCNTHNVGDVLERDEYNIEIIKEI